MVEAPAEPICVRLASPPAKPSVAMGDPCSRLCVIFSSCNDEEPRCPELTHEPNVPIRPGFGIQTTQPTRYPDPIIAAIRPEWEPERIRGGGFLCCCSKNTEISADIGPSREGPGLPLPADQSPSNTSPVELGPIGVTPELPPTSELSTPSTGALGPSGTGSGLTEQEPAKSGRLPQIRVEEDAPRSRRTSQQASQPRTQLQEGATRSRKGSHASKPRSRHASQTVPPPVPPTPGISLTCGGQRE